MIHIEGTLKIVINRKDIVGEEKNHILQIFYDALHQTITILLPMA
jgi:hypothetical protein